MILELVERHPAGLTNSEISRALGIATSSCSYILARLDKRGYLARSTESGRYRIGLTPLALAHGALRNMGFRSLAEPTLYRLVSETGISASIGVIERGRLLLVDRVESPKFAEDAMQLADSFITSKDRAALARSVGRVRRRELRDIGRELPVHANAPGKAILAYLARDQVMEMIRQHGLERCTPRTIVSEQALLAELEQVRRQGWAESHQEQYLGVCACATPIFDRHENAVAAVSLNGPSSDPIWKERDRLTALIQAAGREISRRIQMP